MRFTMETPSNLDIAHGIQRVLAGSTMLFIDSNLPGNDGQPLVTLTIQDVRCIFACLEGNSLVNTLQIYNYCICSASVFKEFRDRLAACTSVTKVVINLYSEDFDFIRPDVFCTASVTSLHVGRRSRKIGGRCAGDILRDFLTRNNTLGELNLSWCYEAGYDRFALGLGQGLFVNSSLRKVTLMRCYIGNKDLADMLMSGDDTKNTTLSILDLSWNEISGNIGGRSLSVLLTRFPSLQQLFLCNNPLGQIGPEILVPGFTASHLVLKKIHLSWCSIGSRGLANIFPSGQINKSLTHLILLGNGIHGARGGEILGAVITCFPNLQELVLSNNRLGPAGGRLLGRKLCLAKRHGVVKKIVLSNCGLENEGVESFLLFGETNKSVIHLNIAGNNVVGREKTGAALARFDSLQELIIHNNPLGPDGGRSLGLVLATNPFVTVDASYCQLGNGGVGNLLLCRAPNTSVTQLIFSGNGIEGTIGGESLGAIVNRFTNLQELILSRNPLGPDGGVALATGLQGMHHRFRLVDLGRCRLGDIGIRALAEIIGAQDNVESLVMNDNGITPLGLESVTNMIRQCRNMVNLYASLNRNMFNDRQKSEAFADALSDNIHLRELHVRHRPMNEMTQSILMNGVQRNVGLDEFRANLSPEEQSRLLYFLNRNRTVKHMTAHAESIGAMSLPTLLQALEDVSLHKEGISATFAIFRNHHATILSQINQAS